MTCAHANCSRKQGSPTAFRRESEAKLQRPNAAQSAHELTDDEFLGGRVKLWQPKAGFRAGLDSVMLAAAVPAKRGARVCDLGIGVGTAALCLAARVADVHITGLEIDHDLAELARANGARNACESFEVVDGDVFARPRQLPRQAFDHVITNPPFFDIARGTRAPLASKARATSAHRKDLEAWFRFARALVKGEGWVTAILPPDQLTIALGALAPHGQGVEVVPLWPKTGEPAKRIIIRVRMNARAPLRLLPGIVLHRPDGGPTREAEAILRRGEALFK
ncbi:MAG: methyltransferase [Alphaproteobacteria bacterium]|nr:methyltransferase [Alphaproteobacteria bacterium]